MQRELENLNAQISEASLREVASTLHANCESWANRDVSWGVNAHSFAQQAKMILGDPPTANWTSFATTSDLAAD